MSVSNSTTKDLADEVSRLRRRLAKVLQPPSSPGNDSPQPEGGERFLHRCLFELPLPVMVHSEDGEVLLISKAWTELTGYTPEELPTIDAWIRRAFARDQPSIRAGIAALFEQQKPVREHEFRIRTKSGQQRLWDFTSTPVGRLPDGRRAVVSMAIDVTDRLSDSHAAEPAATDDLSGSQHAEQTTARQLQLNQIARVNILGEMAAGLAHEINQPLAAIGNYTAACQDLVAQTPELSGAPIAEYLQEISEQVYRTGQIIRRLRMLVRNSNPHRSTIDINAVVREVVEIAAADARLKGIELALELASALPAVWADRIQLEQVVLNLIQNAMEAVATCPAKRVSISTACLTPAGLARGSVEVAVCDSGEGIEVDDVERVFEPFFSTKPQGMGMGLSICRSIALAHNGNITAENNTGGGATFRLMLPVEEG